MEFQLQAMEINTTTLLFLVTSNLKPKHQEEKDDHDLDHDLDSEDSTLEIMQNCLDVQILGPTCE
jgi:hypothetical protein